MKTSAKALSLFIIFGSLLAGLSGCTLKLAEDYDAQTSGSIIKVAKTTDAFLLNMLVSSSATDGTRTFENYAGGYAAVENELISLGLQNQVRPLHDYTFQITEITLELWLDFAGKHKQNDTMSDLLIDEMRVSMQDAFRAMLIADEGAEYLNLD
ncbi:MAG: hypothetical protein JJ895_03675 [Balneolaceae bacterium]|nr:hypothetical protein [Balneolaceae bacterium]